MVRHAVHTVEFAIYLGLFLQTIAYILFLIMRLFLHIVPDMMANPDRFPSYFRRFQPKPNWLALPLWFWISGSISFGILFFSIIWLSFHYEAGIASNLLALCIFPNMFFIPALLVRVYRKMRDEMSSEHWRVVRHLCLCLLALLLLRYSAGFTWWQIFIAGVAYCLLDFYPSSERARKFHRMEFTISLTRLGQALIDAGVYTDDEVEQNNAALWASLGEYSRGRITFTWLQRDLFFMNTRGVFLDRPSLTIHLKSFGTPAEQMGHPLPSSGWITLRRESDSDDNIDGYHLLLFRHKKPNEAEAPPPLLLIRITDEFFQHLQDRRDAWKSKNYFKRQDEILERMELKFFPGVGHSNYGGKYADLHWYLF